MAVTYTWIGTTNDWNNPANWSHTGGTPLPTASDDVVFNPGSIVYPTTGISVEVGRITFSSSQPNSIAIGPFTGGLSISGGVIFESAFICDGGTNTVNGAVQISSGLPSYILATTNAGVLSFSGNIDFATTAFVSGNGLTEFGNTNTWQMNQNIIINGKLLVSSLGALGANNGGSPPGYIVLAESSTLVIGVNNFTIPSSLSIFLAETFGGDIEVINTNGFNAAIECPISEYLMGALCKDGPGTLTLTGANTYSGGTTVSAGILQGNTTSLQGNMTVSTQANVTFNQTALGTYSGVLSGGGSVTKIGSAALIFSGVNTYTGATLVNGGTLQAGSTPSAFGNNSSVTVGSGAILALNTFPSTIGSLTGPNGSSVDLGSATLTMSNGGNFSGIISGAPGNLTLNGGILTLQGTANTYSGTTLVNAGGTLNIALDSNLGTSALNLANGSTLQAGASFTLARAVSLLGGTANIDSNGNTFTMSGVLSGTGGINKIGADTLIVSNTNLYSGGTTITTGILQVSADGNTGAGGLTISNGATLEAGTSFTLTKGVTLSGAANVDTNGTTLQMSGLIGGSGTLNKIGSGTLQLTNGGNGYLGGTIVNTGILNMLADGNLGGATTELTLLGGTTLQAGASFTLNPIRPVSLGTGLVTIDTFGSNPIIDGVISGPGLLLKQGVGALTVTNANNKYAGGTTIGVGTLVISQDSNLGANGPLTIAGDATLQAAASFALGTDRTINLSGGMGIIDTVVFNPSIAGSITGIGGFQKNGAGTLTVSGANSYSGGTFVNLGTLQGTTSSLQGTIQIGGGTALSFNQATTGTYIGVLTGSGNLNILGKGNVTVSGSSPSFSGTTTVSGNSTLTITGSLASSPASITSGSTLTGTGTIGTVTNAGKIIPLRTHTLNINGNLSFTPTGTLLTQLTPTTTNLLAVTGTASLANGTSEIDLFPGFYGVNGARTILTAGLVDGSFANLVLDPRITGSLVYKGTKVELVFQVINPFLDFPFANENEKAVGRNLDALLDSGQISSDLISLIDSFAGLSIDGINDALDQMHPAAFGAFAEAQTELGGQLLSLFHHLPTFSCGCNQGSRIWVLPFGNWLHEKKQGEEIGFHARTRGIAFGMDHQFFRKWTLGIGGAYSTTDFAWSLHRGYAYVESGYVAIYSDLFAGNFFLGISGYAGKDFYDAHRHIHFSRADRQASSHFNGIDLGGQLKTAYYFGTPSFQLYPYATVDYLYLKNQSFREKGATSLNLIVTSYTSSTLRTEAGGAISFVDRNPIATICIAPMVSMGYVLELPLHRDHFHARFENTTISFTTRGWDMAWQLLNLQAGLEITYRCLSLNSSYSADISPEGNSPFFNQRANFKLSVNF